MAVEVRPDSATSPPRHTTRATIAALVGWVALVSLGRWWGLALLTHHQALTLPEPPLLGRPGPGLTPRLLVPLGVGLLLIGGAPWAVRRLRWRPLLLVTAGATAAWAVALALVDGPNGLTHGLAGHTELGTDVPTVAAGPLRFLSTFSAQITRYQVQARGHPPGMILILAAMNRLGLAGNGWAAALCIASGCIGSVAVVVAVDEVCGRETARRAAPFVAIAPAAIWIATSADAFYLGVAAVSVTTLVLAVNRTGRRADRLAVLGGIGLGACLMLSYGLVLVMVLPALVGWRARRMRPLVLAGAAAAGVLGVFALLGFWWPIGLLATREQYDRLHVWRPWWYFVVANLSAWAIALGPAIAVALCRLRDRSVMVLVGAAVLAAALADLSGLSEGEVERIWLPFTVWVLAAGAALWTNSPPHARPVAERHVQGWLALQAATAIALVSLVRTQW